MRPKSDTVLDESVCKSISEIIHELTHKNHKLLNEDAVKKLTDLTKLVYCIRTSIATCNFLNQMFISEIRTHILIESIALWWITSRNLILN